MKKLIVVLGLLCLCGCNGTERARMWAYNKQWHVKLFAADGRIIGEWDTQDQVQSEEHSDGWYFTDAKTGRLKLISGTIEAEQK